MEGGMIVRGAETVAERARGGEEAAKEQLSSIPVPIPAKTQSGRRPGEEADGPASPVPLSQQLPKLEPKKSASRYVTSHRFRLSLF